MTNKAALARLVNEKLNAAQKKIHETQGSNALESAQAKLQVLFDYSLFFQGADETLKAIGVPADEGKTIELAIGSINADIAAEQQRLLLAQELNSATDEG